MADLSRRSFFKQFLPARSENDTTATSSSVARARSFSIKSSTSKSVLPPKHQDVKESDHSDLKAKILENCITKLGFDCNLCQEACPAPKKAIYYSSRGFATIDSDKCNGCGDCLSACMLIPKAIEIN